MHRFAVIGLGRFGMQLVEALTEAGGEVIAIDRDRELVEQVRDHAALAIRMDSSDEEAMRSQGVDEVDVGVVGIGHNFEAAALTTVVLKNLGVKKVIARASSRTQTRILRSIGADEVVYPEGESAERWANQLMMYRVKNLVELGESHSLIWLTAPAGFHNKTPIELELRQKFHVNIVAISRTVQVRTDDDSLQYQSAVASVPDANTTILPNDTLILVGSNDALAALPTE